MSQITDLRASVDATKEKAAANSAKLDQVIALIKSPTEPDADVTAIQSEVEDINTGLDADAAKLDTALAASAPVDGGTPVDGTPVDTTGDGSIPTGGESTAPQP